MKKLGKIRFWVNELKVRARSFAEDTRGITTIELLLILVVLIALVLIFKTQLTNLINTIFNKITSESAGI